MADLIHHMKNTHDTPETDATTSDFDNSALWATEDFQRALITISELRRERDEARIPICIGPPLIQILAKLTPFLKP